MRYSGFKLLIVDDHAHNLFTLRTLVRRHMDVVILEASSGQEALDITLKQPDLDLIILDVQMPDMDGFQTASMLKMRKKTRDIPIIFLTAAFKSEEFQQRGYAIGAVDYLLKPIDDNLLVNKISSYFRLIEKERALNVLLEQKVAERTAELQEAKQYLENILTYMGEALLVLNPQGEITQVNPAACQMLDYQARDLLGMSIGDVFEEEGDEAAGAFFGTWLEALIRTGALSKIEARFIAQDGARIPILFARTALKSAEGAITHIICIAKNMSGYRRIEDDESTAPEITARAAGTPH